MFSSVIWYSDISISSSPAGQSQQMRIFARTTLRPELQSSRVNQRIPAGIHNLFIRVYACGGDVWCALDLDEISGFSGILECTLFYMAEVWILCFCVHVHRYCCMSQYCLNWRIWVQLKIWLLNWTDRFCSSILTLNFSNVFQIVKRKRKYFHPHGLKRKK